MECSYKGALVKLPDLASMSVDELVGAYAAIPQELRKRGIIRSNNFLGDLGEHLAIKLYKETPGLPNLQAAPPGTQNVDAISREGKRYSIKSTRRRTTGVFYGLNDPRSNEPEEHKFEYVVIVEFTDDFSIRRVCELDWRAFLKHKRWQSRMRAWYLTITKQLLADAKILHDSEATPSPQR